MKLKSDFKFEWNTKKNMPNCVLKYIFICVCVFHPLCMWVRECVCICLWVCVHLFGSVSFRFCRGDSRAVLSLTHTNTLPLSHTHTNTLSLSLTRTNILSLSLTHTNTLTTEYRLFYRALLQKRPINLRSLLIVAIP